MKIISVSKEYKVFLTGFVLLALLFLATLAFARLNFVTLEETMRVFLEHTEKMDDWQVFIYLFLKNLIALAIIAFLSAGLCAVTAPFHPKSQ